MTLEQLIAISEKASLKEVTPLVIEYQTIKENYHPPEKALMVYMASKYIHGENRHFISWYSEHQDLFDSKYVKRMEQRQLPFDPHKFP